MSLPRALFVAREPDETLRTYLPVLSELTAAGRVEPYLLFHHTPGDWARAELRQLAVPWEQVQNPALEPPGGMLGRAAGATRLATPLGEIGQLRRARTLAAALLDRLRPQVLIVIQDTLLLERFLVRAANQSGIATLVVQWAFTYPQEYYDRFQEQKRAARRRSGARALVARVTSAAYQAALGALGLRFVLANTYGGGEAEYLAVMGSGFKEQFLAQGARKREVIVSGHPSHDAVFERVRDWTETERIRVLESLGFTAQQRLVTYATQPTLWRGVLDFAELRSMVETVVSAVQAQDERFALVVKLHPRESLDDYAFLEGRQGVRVIRDADVQRLIAASDVFVSSSSSTLLFAMMFDKPIVTINFHAVPHFEYFAGLGGTLHVRQAERFESALRAALSDQATRAELRAGQRQVLARYSRFDGGATRRLQTLIEGWALADLKT